jgi:hypothetical protein
MALTRPKYSQIYDTDWKQSVEVATTGDVGNLFLGNLQPNSIDGVSLAFGTRILVKDQTRAFENGLYTVASVGTGSNGWWKRTLDASQSSFVTAGLTVSVTSGSLNGAKEFKLTTPDPITLDVTNLTFINPFAGGSAAGANTYVQFNDGGLAGGTPGLTFNKYTNALSTGGNITTTNDVTANRFFGNIGGGSVLPNVYITGSLIPTANVAYDLGTPTQKFRSAYFSGNTVYIGGESMSVSTNGTWSFTSAGANVSLGADAVFNPPAANIAGNMFAGAVYSPIIGNTTTVATLASAEVTGNVSALGVYAAHIGNASTTLTGIMSTASQTNITSVGSLTGLSVAGNTTVFGNLTVYGNITTIGNVNNITITGNAGQFFGNAAGFGALYAGIGTGYVYEPQTTLQISSNFNGYAQLNMQNINPGALSSADFIVTADNGTIENTYLDLGLASSTYNYPGFGLLHPNDGYLLVYGNDVTGGGNLVLGSGGGGLLNDIIFATGGFDHVDEYGRIDAALDSFVVKSTTPSTSTSTGALTVAGGIGVVGNINAGFFYGNGSQLTGLPAGYSNVQVATYLPGYTGTIGLVNSTGNVLATNGTFNSLVVNGTLTASAYVNFAANVSAARGDFGNASIAGGTHTGINAISPAGNAAVTLGSLTNQWSTIYGRSTSAQYADLAEIYTSDKKYVPGTVLIFGGNQEVTISTQSHDTRIAGVVSTNPAYLMNSTETGVEVALTGRVPCQVLGPVAKGDRLVASHWPGIAQRLNSAQYEPGCIIGKSLEDILDDRVHTIEVVVGRV